MAGTWLRWPSRMLQTWDRDEQAAALAALENDLPPLCAAEVITGASLVPVMVMVTVCVAVPPWPSATVTS